MSRSFGAWKQDEGTGVVRIEVHGEIDEDVGAALTVIICNAAEHGAPHTLIVDLAYCSFLAAAGVRSLLEGRQAAWDRACSYRVVNAYGIVAQVLNAAGVPGLIAPPVEKRSTSGVRRNGRYPQSVTLDTHRSAPEGL